MTLLDQQLPLKFVPPQPRIVLRTRSARSQFMCDWTDGAATRAEVMRVIRVANRMNNRIRRRENDVVGAKRSGRVGYAELKLAAQARVRQRHLIRRLVPFAAGLEADMHALPAEAAFAAAPPSITCPVCGRRSYNPNDICEGYCGACHAYTSWRP